MKNRTYLVVGGVVILGATLSVLAWFGGMGKIALPRSVPREIASIPTPVTKVVGRVDKLEADTLTLTQRFPEGDLTVRVSLTQDTKMFKPRPFIPYLLKSVHADVAEAIAKTDLTPGTLVTVTTKDDLRQSGVGKPVPATVVEITVYNTSIQGVIREVRGNTFTMDAAVPLLPPNIPTDRLEQAKERTYTVTYTTGTTELSRKKTGKAVAVHPDELKPGVAVTVYAVSDVSLLTSVPAVLIRFPDQE